MSAASLGGHRQPSLTALFFGHQSVGANIPHGVRDLLNEAGRDWPIVELGADCRLAAP